MVLAVLTIISHKPHVPPTITSPLNIISTFSIVIIALWGNSNKRKNISILNVVLIRDRYFYRTPWFLWCNMLRKFWFNNFAFYAIKLQVFTGNSNQGGIMKNSLQEFASAKFIRFQPTAYNSYKALRVEVYGLVPTKGIYYYFHFCLPLW